MKRKTPRTPNRPSPDNLRDKLRRFAAQRDWEQFHTPKNLAMALTVEAAELQECFQWLTPGQCETLSPADRRAVEEEIADVLLYLIRLSDVLNIDMLQAARRKLVINARKYPVRLAKGSSRKYSRR
jgi:dCTP diphosphatase